MTMRAGDDGFTLVEVLVAISLFSILSVGFYQVMFSGVRGSDTANNVARISQEARIGFNRMIRDTREAGGHCFSGATPTCGLVTATPTSYSVEVDFNNDQDVDHALDEYLRYTFDAGAGTISITSLNADGSVRSGPDVLVSGVSQIDDDTPIFGYSSNHLEWDWKNWSTANGTTGADGVTSWQEIDAPPPGVNGVGDGDSTIDDLGDNNPREVFFLSEISYSFVISEGGRSSTFRGQAALRNRRFATS